MESITRDDAFARAFAQYPHARTISIDIDEIIQHYQYAAAYFLHVRIFFLGNESCVADITTRYRWDYLAENIDGDDFACLQLLDNRVYDLVEIDEVIAA